jgi:hypothetical protein
MRCLLPQNRVRHVLKRRTELTLDIIPSIRSDLLESRAKFAIIQCLQAQGKGK